VDLAHPSPYTVTTVSTGTATATSIGFTSHPDQKEAYVPVPWVGASRGTDCSGTSGAIWNNKVVPFMNATTFAGPDVSTPKDIDRKKKALMTIARLEKASFGGVTATGEIAPMGCALKNDATADARWGAAAYMSAVQASDALLNALEESPAVPRTPCWSNNIVLVVDGHSDGAGDMGPAVDCASAACASNNPVKNGCQCAAINKAFALAHPDLLEPPAVGVPPIQTHVVVDVPARWSARYPYTYAFMWNLAVAGSPHFDGVPTFGTTEDEVYKGISDKIALAAHLIPSYTTTAPVPGANTQDPSTKVVVNSAYLYAAASSYPSWKGTLRAYDTTSGVQLLWDAASVAANGHPSDWTKRRIYFQNASSGVPNNQVLPVQITSSGNISNKDALNSAGLGASADEAERIMQWLLGKPGLGNPAPLMGPVSASTPIVVGQAPDNGLVGAKKYSENTWKRPPLVYVGADDGMLHAFFAHAGSKTLGTQTYEGGEEAFAFIPNDMFAVITKLYAQGGQPLAPDKGQHIFGLAGSPKVKDMCTGAGCDSDQTGGGWRTILVMTEGAGGNKPFALNITNVVAENAFTPDNLSPLQWSVASASDSRWAADLGETTSVPGFYYDPANAENRVLFASGYPTDPTATGQGHFILEANAATGEIREAPRDVTTAAAVLSGFGGSAPTNCSAFHPHPRSNPIVLADIAVARDYADQSTSQATAQYLMGAYTGDDWGNAYQYWRNWRASGSAMLGRLYSLGCQQPIHFSPAVVQIDRFPTAPTNAKNMIYLAQVTNSNLDPETQSYPGSLLVVTRLDGSVTSSPPTPDLSFFSSGQITLQTCGASSTANTCICVQGMTGTVVNDFSGGASGKPESQSCQAAGGTNMSTGARPVGTPMAVVRSDGLGFQVITGWYDATATKKAECTGGNPSLFSEGTSYITVHEFRIEGGVWAWSQKAGLKLDNAVLSGGAFVGAGLYVDGIGVTPDVTPRSIRLGESFSTMQQLMNSTGGPRYTRTTWTERFE